MSWLWQPLLPGAAQLQSGGAPPDLSAEAAQAFTFGQTASAELASVPQASAEQAFSFGQSATAIGGAPQRLTIGGWSWPVEHAHKRKKHKEPFDGLRDTIEGIYKRVTGQEPAPAEVAEAAQAVAAIVEPYVTNDAIDWRTALRTKAFEYELAIAAAAYEQALRDAIEEDELEDLLLLAA